MWGVAMTGFAVCFKSFLFDFGLGAIVIYTRMGHKSTYSSFRFIVFPHIMYICVCIYIYIYIYVIVCVFRFAAQTLLSILWH